jgi:hypothetical protein
MALMVAQQGSKERREAAPVLLPGTPEQQVSVAALADRVKLHSPSAGP